MLFATGLLLVALVSFNPDDPCSAKFKIESQINELSSLRAEDECLKRDLDNLKFTEDRWNWWNINASIWGVVLGGVVGLAFGMTVFISSSKARNSSMATRPLTDRREAISARIRHLMDQEADAKTASALERAGVAEEAAAEANRAAEQERIERLHLEARVNPRRLTEEQQRQIGATCKGPVLRGIVLRSYQGDAESFVLGEQIERALAFSGYMVQNELGTDQSTGKPDQGVQVRSSLRELAVAECLANVLRVAGGLDVILNGPMQSNDAIITGAYITLGFSNHPPLPAGPLSDDSPVTVRVGIKPMTPLKGKS